MKDASGCGNFSLHWRPVGDLVLLFFSMVGLLSLWHIPHFHSQFYKTKLNQQFSSGIHVSCSNRLDDRYSRSLQFVLSFPSIFSYIVYNKSCTKIIMQKNDWIRHYYVTIMVFIYNDTRLFRYQDDLVYKFTSWDSWLWNHMLSIHKTAIYSQNDITNICIDTRIRIIYTRRALSTKNSSVTLETRKFKKKNTPTSVRRWKVLKTRNSMWRFVSLAIIPHLFFIFLFVPFLLFLSLSQPQINDLTCITSYKEMFFFRFNVSIIL